MGDDERYIRALLEAESERAPRTQGLRRSTIRRGLGGRISIVALPALVVASIAWMAIASPFAPDPESDVVAPGPQAQDGLIAFTTQKQGEASSWIAVVPASGGEVTRLHEGRDPAWSPDGTRIAFGCDRGICTMKADGSEVSQLTDPPAPAYDEEPNWGPGGFIAFTRSHMDGSQGRDILMIRQEGGRPTPLIEEEANFAPSWSPDGRAIAFVRGIGPLLDAPEGGFQLWRMNADGSGLVRLTEDGAGRPDWSPDGSSILFDEASTLWTIPADGGEPRKLPMVGGRGFDVGSFATWAPDSRRIAFMCSSTGSDNNDICLSETNSKGWNVLVATDEIEASPAWQPSTPNEEIAEATPTEAPGGYVVGSDEIVMAFGSEDDIWLAISDGSVVNITQSPETESSPTISFDDKVLVYEREGGLVYLRLDTGESAEFADGYSPAFGPLDYLAWDSGAGEVVVGSPFSDWTVRAPNGPRGQGATSFSFAWDQSLELLHYSIAVGHGVSPHYIDLVRVDGWECAECGGGLELGRVRELQPDDGTEGEFLSTSFGTSVDVLRVCCRESDSDPWQTAEIGGLDSFDTGTLYNRLRSLDDVPLDLSGTNLGLAHAGSLEATVKGDAVEWQVTNRNAWFVINDFNLWLLTDGRDPVLLPFQVSGGVAVAPAFARSPLIHSF
jgi:Tol biopolymer transport system component